MEGEYTYQAPSAFRDLDPLVLEQLNLTSEHMLLDKCFPKIKNDRKLDQFNEIGAGLNFHFIKCNE